MKLCILAKGDSWARLHTLVGLVATAAHLEWDCHVLLTYGVLARYVEGTMSEAADMALGISTPTAAKAVARAVEAGRLPALVARFAAAREAAGGRFKLYGCTTTVKVLDLPAERLAKLDGLLGHAAFLMLCEDGQLVTT